MLKGSCCCGAIQFQLNNLPTMMGTCHCSRCRKLGSSTLIFVQKNDFILLQGQEFIEKFQPEPPFHYTRSFCKKCGTALGEIGSTNDSFPIPANCLDDHLPLNIQFHVHVASKPHWYEICDSAPQFLENPN
ncbi:GFA family protein [Acinetobacter equi]|uniref:Aldehyde-activating protein n=1 Tax=Acinetobacter equi TaxID=1324350 RepID=A0A0N9VAT7_9GAMM|nr:GFA family protein [Acinetobacter equi]ALH96473.1 aldehyde-activating protein [Acinetobacter equi]